MSQHAYLTGIAVFIGFVGFMAASSPIFSNPLGGGIEGGVTSPQDIESCQNNNTFTCAKDLSLNFAGLLIGSATSNPFLAVIMIALTLGVVYIIADLIIPG